MFVGSQKDDPFVELEELDKDEAFEKMQSSMVDNQILSMAKVPSFAIDNDMLRF